jgi:hypothetical protein
MKKTREKEGVQTFGRSGVQQIRAERGRHKGLGWSAFHDDDEHDQGELAQAAAAYLLFDRLGPYPMTGFDLVVFEAVWPWPTCQFNPGDSGNRQRRLVKAGALIAAELDRLERIRRKVAQ